MIRKSVSLLVGLTSVLVLVFGALQPATAGQFRRVDQTATLAVNQQISFHVSPVNHTTAMEMDVWEWLSRNGPGSYRLRITQNNTGRALTIRMIGLTGAQFAGIQCTSNPNPCDTPSIALGSNFLFMAIVATAANQPVAAGSHYTIAIQRTA